MSIRYSICRKDSETQENGRKEDGLILKGSRLGIAKADSNVVRDNIVLGPSERRRANVGESICPRV